VYSKWYRNSEHTTFTDVFKTFLQEAAEAGAAIKVCMYEQALSICAS